LLHNDQLRAYHEFVYTLFFGFAAHDAVAAVLYVVEKMQGTIDDLLFLTVHTPGDSDSIASIAAAMFTALDEDESLSLLR
jgi:ADP-ribosylglycohydrolase